jgi:hypothetical protein
MVIAFVTIQKILYFYLIFSIAMLITLYFKPLQVSALFKRKTIYLPLTVGILVLISLFIQHRYKEYSDNYRKLPPGVEHDHSSIAYLDWARNRNKLERDLYLALSCILSQLFLVSSSRLIQTHHTYKEFQERSRKIE